MPVPNYPMADLPTLVGQTLGHSDWITVDQARVDAFAHATGDLQWIHIDPQRAASGPFGCTIAHGFLTLALLPVMSSQAYDIPDATLRVNYGLNKLRFPAPVPVGSRLRGHFKLLSCVAVDKGWQLTLEVTMEREGGDKPVCVAQAVALMLTE